MNEPLLNTVVIIVDGEIQLIQKLSDNDLFEKGGSITKILNKYYNKNLKQ